MSATQRRPTAKAAASAGWKRSSDSIVTNTINKFPQKNNLVMHQNRHSDNALSDPGYDSGDDPAYENAHNHEVETEEEQDPVHVQGQDGGSSNQTNIAFEPEQPLRQGSKRPQVSSGTPSSQQWMRSDTPASLEQDQSFNTHNSTQSIRVPQSESQIKSSSFMSVDGEDEEQGHGPLAWGNVTCCQVTHLGTPLLSNNSMIVTGSE